MQAVPADGETMGEIFFRGNLLMKGYLKNAQATEEAFAGGWFHTGDLAVMQADRYVKIKDRSKDVIISGGENISSVEVEEVLYRHPAVLAAAVVAKPDPKWGEVAAAFVEMRDGATATEAEIIEHCRAEMARFKVPKQVIFGVVAEDLDRQDPEVRAARAAAFGLGHRLKARNHEYLRPPLRDMLFAMKELGGLEAVLAQPGNEEVTGELVEAILDEAVEIRVTTCATATSSSCRPAWASRRHS